MRRMVVWSRRLVAVVATLASCGLVQAVTVAETIETTTSEKIVDVVRDGELLSAQAVGPWQASDAGIQGSGVGSLLWSADRIESGDFKVEVRLTIDELAGSAASLVIGDNSHFGFEGRHGEPFVEGPLFGGGSRELGGWSGRFKEGQPIEVLLEREGTRLRITAAGHSESFEIGDGPIGPIGVRPWRATVAVHALKMRGLLSPDPRVLGWVDDLPAESVDVFVAGADGYHTYRIPSVIRTPEGALLAFAEGRKSGRGDAGDIDLVLKRSEDGGRTWGPLQVVWNDGANTCGNPAPVIDHQTGRIWLPLTWNLGTDHEGAIKAGTSQYPRRVYLSWSDDDGKTWAEPREMPHLRRDYWRWYATGPDKGIQLTRGPHRGRLIVPCNHSDHRDSGVHPFRSHVIYSDDHGETWQIGGVHESATNESTIAELSSGAVIDNMRSYHGKNRRAVAVSEDGGQTWGPLRLDSALIEPVCQASLLRASWADESAGRPGRLVFSNPASKSRDHMTVRVSYDDGASWPVERLIYGGSAAYSCLVNLPEEQIGLLFERDDYQRITWIPLPLDWLEAEQQ